MSPYRPLPPLLLLFVGVTAAIGITPAMIKGSPSRYVRSAYRVGLDEAVAMTCSFRNTEASLGYFALGSEADFTGRTIIWQKVDSTGGEELIAIGSRVEPKLGAFHDYRVLFADATTSVLFIPRTTHYHNGYYKCSLSDGGFLHQMMHVNVTNQHMVMRHPLENTHYIAPGAEVRLTCDVKFTYPPPLIYWTHGRPRMQKSVRPVAWGPVLAMNAMNSNLAGTYTCHADDFLQPPISTSYRILMQKRNEGSKPAFLTAQYNHAPVRFATKKPRYGQLYALTCRSNGSPTIGFHWFRNATNVKEVKDPNLSIHTSKGSNGDVISELHIRQFKLKDRGNYTCKAFNSFGSKHHIFQLFSITDLPPLLRKKFAQSSRRRLSYSRRLPRPPVDDDDFGSGSGLGPVVTSSLSAATTAAAKAQKGVVATRAPWRYVPPSDISGSGLGDYYPSRATSNMSRVAGVSAKRAAG